MSGISEDLDTFFGALEKIDDEVWLQLLAFCSIDSTSQRSDAISELTRNILSQGFMRLKSKLGGSEPFGLSESDCIDAWLSAEKHPLLSLSPETILNMTQVA